MLRSLVWAGLGTGFIFLMTTLGAATVFFFAGELKLRCRSAMMGFAAGVMLAASVWSMTLPAMERAAAAGLHPAWLPAVLGIAAGMTFLLLLDGIIAQQSRGGADALATSLLVTAITVHSMPEGMSVGLAFALAARGEPLAGALALALGIGLQNLPEGAAVSLPMRQLGMTQRRAFLTGVLSGAVEPLFGVLAVLAVSGVQGAMPWLLGFSAGAMLYVVMHELIPAAPGRAGTLGFFGGFLLMLVLDVALG